MDRLRQCLDQAPGQLNDANKLSQVPLHLASDWADGIEMLVADGAQTDVPDVYGLTPIQYAIRNGNLHAFRILLEAGCDLCGLSGMFTSEMRLFRHAFVRPPMRTTGLLLEFLLFMNCGRNFVSLFIKHLALRRRRIEAIAEETRLTRFLDERDVNGFRPILDRKAPIAMELIRKAGLDIQNSGSIPKSRSTVYHSLALRPYTAFLELAWRIGFKDVDSENEDEMTPVMIMFAHFELSQTYGGMKKFFHAMGWFFAKGADFNAVIPSVHLNPGRIPVLKQDGLKSLSVQHIVGSQLGFWLAHYGRPFARNVQLLRVYRRCKAFDKLWDNLLRSKHQGPFQCSCTEGSSCTSLSQLLRAMARRDMGLWEEEFAGLVSKSQRRVRDMVIRFATFEQLHLR